MQDESLSRRDRDTSRRLVLRWLQGRGLDLRESDGVLAIGRWEDEEARAGRFLPELEVLPDGSVQPWETASEDEPESEEASEKRLAPEERRVLRSNVETLVEHARGKPEETTALMDLLTNMDAPGWMRSDDWRDQEEVFEPLLRRLEELGPETLCRFVGSWSPESSAAVFLVERLGDWAEANAGWRPPADIDWFWVEARGWEADRAWEHTFKLAARAGERLDPRLRQLLFARGATSHDLIWAGGVLGHRRDPAAAQLLREALGFWRGLRRYDNVDLIATDLVDLGNPNDAEYLLELVREGVAKGVAMVETLDAVGRLRVPARPSEAQARLMGRDVDWDRLRFSTMMRVTTEGSYLHRTTGEIRIALPDSGSDASTPPPDWWPIPSLEPDAYRDWVRRFAATVGPPLSANVAKAANQFFFLRDAANALLGHPDEWIRFHDERDRFEAQFAEEVASRALDAMGALVAQPPRRPPA